MKILNKKLYNAIMQWISQDEAVACSARWYSWMVSIFGVTFLWWDVVEVCSARWFY